MDRLCAEWGERAKNVRDYQATREDNARDAWGRGKITIMTATARGLIGSRTAFFFCAFFTFLEGLLLDSIPTHPLSFLLAFYGYLTFSIIYSYHAVLVMATYSRQQIIQAVKPPPPGISMPPLSWCSNVFSHSLPSKRTALFITYCSRYECDFQKSILTACLANTISVKQ